MVFRSRWWLAIVWILVASSAPARTIVVAKTGNDANAGTAEAPLLTISQAAAVAKPGDTVLVREGVYRERVAPARGGWPGKPIVYRAAPGERVIVKGSEVWTPDWRDEGSGVFSATPAASLFNDRSDEYLDSHNPFEVELSSTPYGRQGRREHERMLDGDKRIKEANPDIVFTCGQVFVDGELLREVPLLDELEPRTWFYERSGRRLHVHFGDASPADHKVELTTRRRIFAPKRRGLGHITVEGFVFEHCGNQYPTDFWRNDANGQKGAVGAESGHHWILRRNVVRHAKTFAIDIGRVDRHNNGPDAHDNLVEENYIVENGSAGILSNGSRNLVIRGNVILRNNQLRFAGIKRWEQAGVKCHHFDSGLIEDNYIARNVQTYGVWLDNQFPNCRVRRNVIVDNGGPGIFLEMSDYGFDTLLIDNNVVIGNKKNAVYIHDASGATFAHNLLADTREADDRGEAVFIRQAGPRTKTYHHSFYNNLMLDNPRNVGVNYPAERSGAQRFDGNVYGIAAESREFRINPQSDKPHPWSDDEFRELVTTDLQRAGVDNPPPFDDDEATLTLEEWRGFWRRHNEQNDTRSEVSLGTSVEFDREKHVVEIVAEIDPESVATVDVPAVREDYLGEPMPAESRQAAPGPFQSLRRGVNRFKVWDGMPLLPPGELPPLDWNRVVDQ